MHGPSFQGDGARALDELAGAYEDLIASSNAALAG